MYNLFEECRKASNYVQSGYDIDYKFQRDGAILRIFFKCSDSKLDWLGNFNFPARTYKNGNSKWRCHRGFLRRWKLIRRTIETEVSVILAQGGVELIEVVGYSHGAALALLCHEDMQYLFGLLVRVRGYGFGCPRVAWGEVPDEVCERLATFIDVQNGRDIVTRVPPKWLGFKDVFGARIKLDPEHKYGPFLAHYPESYLAELKEVEVDDENHNH